MDSTGELLKEKRFINKALQVLLERSVLEHLEFVGGSNGYVVSQDQECVCL